MPIIPLRQCREQLQCAFANASCTRIGNVSFPSTYLNFDSGARSIVAIFVVMFGDGWFGLLPTTMDLYGDWAILVFVSAYWIGGLFLCNMPVAIFCCVFLDRIHHLKTQDHVAQVAEREENSNSNNINNNSNSITGPRNLSPEAGEIKIEDKRSLIGLAGYAHMEDLAIRRLTGSIGTFRHKLQHSPQRPCASPSVVCSTSSRSDQHHAAHRRNAVLGRARPLCKPAYVSVVNATRQILSAPGKTVLLDEDGYEEISRSIKPVGLLSVDAVSVDGLEEEMELHDGAYVHVRLVDIAAWDSTERLFGAEEGSKAMDEDRRDKSKHARAPGSHVGYSNGCFGNMFKKKHHDVEQLSPGLVVVDQKFVREIRSADDEWEIQVCRSVG